MVSVLYHHKGGRGRGCLPVHMICLMFALRRVLMAEAVRGFNLFSNTINPRNVKPVSTSFLFTSVSMTDSSKALAGLLYLFSLWSLCHFTPNSCLDAHAITR